MNQNIVKTIREVTANVLPREFDNSLGQVTLILKPSIHEIGSAKHRFSIILCCKFVRR